MVQTQPSAARQTPDSFDAVATVSVTGDNPVPVDGHDLLDRAEMADAFALRVTALDRSEGVVVGVLGPWGSGKTSFINLAKKTLVAEAEVVIDFNPWMFSGAEQLVQSFFVELAAGMRVNEGLKGVSEDLQVYGEIVSGLGWVPFVGGWMSRFGRGSKQLGKMLERRNEGIGGQREKLRDALTKLDKPVVVVIDDIDRLTTPEIRDIFKLIRLTANFPNVIYIVAFDRSVVEKALTEEAVLGRDFLEKILLVGFALPPVSDTVLRKLALTEIGAACPATTRLRMEVCEEVIFPLLRNMRDVRRYVAAVRWTLSELKDINVTDVLALEAVRVFLPDVFAALQGAAVGLTRPHDSADLSDISSAASQVKGLVELGSERSEVVKSMVHHLFPHGERHLTAEAGVTHATVKAISDEKRVGAKETLDRYLDSFGVGV